MFSHRIDGKQYIYAVTFDNQRPSSHACNQNALSANCSPINRLISPEPYWKLFDPFWLCNRSITTPEESHLALFTSIAFPRNILTIPMPGFVCADKLGMPGIS